MQCPIIDQHRCVGFVAEVKRYERLLREVGYSKLCEEWRQDDEDRLDLALLKMVHEYRTKTYKSSRTLARENPKPSNDVANGIAWLCLICICMVIRICLYLH
jgi:hypothetical protein